MRKRKWREGTFDVSTEKVQYLYALPMKNMDIGFTKKESLPDLRMKPAQLPISEESWMALEKETVDALVMRRRMGEKSAIRKVEQEDEKEAEKSEDRKRG